MFVGGTTIQGIFNDRELLYVYLFECVGDNFLYFGFGSNLLAARMRLQNPSAVFYTTACLSDYHLTFDRVSSRWKGASATILPLPGDHVWGVVWLIKSTEMNNLDRQEGVHLNIYRVSIAVAKCCEQILLKDPTICI